MYFLDSSTQPPSNKMNVKNATKIGKLHIQLDIAKGLNSGCLIKEKMVKTYDSQLFDFFYGYSKINHNKKDYLSSQFNWEISTRCKTQVWGVDASNYPENGNTISILKKP